MAIGSIFKYVGKDAFMPKFKRWLKNMYFKVYGTPDLHSHMRWRAIKNFINFNAQKVLDVGCGEGMFLFELARNNSAMRGFGIDINKQSVEAANYIKGSLGLNNIEFYLVDVGEPYPWRDGYFDQILLIDVIEHVANDEGLIAEVSRVLKSNGVIIISVPTPNYPRYFGINFHKEIGHIRNGYWIKDLIRLIEKYELEVIDYCYYTYLPSALLCGLFYRYFRKLNISFLLSPILNILSFTDYIWPIRTGKFSCSLVLKAKRRG